MHPFLAQVRPVDTTFGVVDGDKVRTSVGVIDGDEVGTSVAVAVGDEVGIFVMRVASMQRPPLLYEFKPIQPQALFRLQLSLLFTGLHSACAAVTGAFVGVSVGGAVNAVGEFVMRVASMQRPPLLYELEPIQPQARFRLQLVLLFTGLHSACAAVTGEFVGVSVGGAVGTVGFFVVG